MRKFVGNVNGKTFDNEKDFNIAAEEAINSNDGILSISSYYTYISDELIGDNKEIEEKTDVAESEYSIDGKTATVKDDQSFVFEITDELTKKLENAANKLEIKKNVHKFIESLKNQIDVDSTEMKSIQDDIEKLQDKLYEKELVVNTMEAAKKYYNSIKDIVSKECADSAKKVKDIRSAKSLHEFLNKMGFDR